MSAAPVREFESEKLLRAALTYARRGWAVFPIHTPTPEGGCDCRKRDCENPGKHPRVANGFRDASTDDAHVRAWWAMWPTANIGIACGASGIVVIDVDPRHGGDESLRDLIAIHGDGWLETVTALTGGGGSHYVYAAVPGERVGNSASALGPGIDIRGDGGYIVAPPSLHASGQHYEWEKSAKDTPLSEYPPFARQVRRAQRSGSGEVTERIPKGERDETLTSLAGSMRRRGMGEDAIYAALAAENGAKCDPPLPEDEVRRIAHSVARYTPAIKVRTRIVQEPSYNSLRVIQTDPPWYLLSVNGIDVRLTTDELWTYRSVRKAVGDQLHHYLPPLKQEGWEDVLSGLWDDIEAVSAPEDASEAGVVWGVMREVLALTTDEVELFPAKPLEREEMVLATGNMIRDSLRMRGYTHIEQRKLWEIARAHGAVQKNTTIHNRQVWVWAFPIATVEA